MKNCLKIKTHSKMSKVFRSRSKKLKMVRKPQSGKKLLYKNQRILVRILKEQKIFHLYKKQENKASTIENHYLSKVFHPDKENRKMMHNRQREFLQKLIIKSYKKSRPQILSHNLRVLFKSRDKCQWDLLKKCKSSCSSQKFHLNKLRKMQGNRKTNFIRLY